MADRLLVSEDLNLRLHPYRQSRVQRCADPAFPLVCLPLMPKPWALTVWIWDSPERLRCGGRAAIASAVSQTVRTHGQVNLRLCGFSVESTYSPDWQNWLAMFPSAGVRLVR
jgi:hypothetical protein